MKKKQNSFFDSFTKGPRSIFVVAIFFFLGLGVLSYFADTSEKIQVLSYSAFLEKVEQGDINKVSFSGTQATGAFKDGKPFEATVAQNDAMWALLKKQKVDFKIEEPSSISPWYMLFMFALFGLFMFGWMLLRKMKGGSGSNSGSSGGIFSIGKSRAKIFTPEKAPITFADVAGAQEAKDSLQDVIDYLKNPDQFKRLGAKAPRGVLLVGEPGNGKTLLAKAVAGQAGCPFFSISGSDFIEVFVGVGAARIRDLFEQARRSAPSIIFIDEIDTIGRQRGTGLGGGHDEREQTLNQLLAEMDGFGQDQAPVVVIGATNFSESLDRALLRPGRFDRQVLVPYPDLEARKQLLKISLKSLRASSNIDIDSLAEQTAGFSGADLANLANQAAILASKEKSSEVTQDHFIRAFDLLKKPQDEGGGSVHTASKTSSRARLYMPSQVKTTFKDVAGVYEAKEELADVIDFLKNPTKYKKLGASLTRGVLLVGDPGNGKTLLAKAVAGEANRPFFSASASEFIEMYVGVGAARVRDLFAQARKNAPSIIFIDEIDAVGAKRTGLAGSGGDEHSQTLNQLLAEMDGFDSKGSSVVVLAATNRPDILDSALMRPGRFDRRVDVPYPDLKSREEILQLHISKLPIDGSVDIKKIARGTPGFSAAYLANLVNEAAIDAAKKNQDLVTLANFDEARDKIILGKALKSITLTPEDIRETAIHEAGHALVALMTPKVSDPLYKVTVIPRGRSLGVTASIPEREQHNRTKAQLEGDVMMALGGRIAESLVLGADRISTGAYMDIRQATTVARRMVCAYGMSDLGFVSYDSRDGEFAYASETAHKIDQEVKKIIDAGYVHVEDILRKNIDKLNKLTDALVEKETLFAQEIYELLGIESREVSSLDAGIIVDA